MRFESQHAGTKWFSIKDMDQIDKKGFIDSSTRFNFVKNAVVLIQSTDSALQINGFHELLKPDIQMISIGNPHTVLAGKYAQEVFTYYKMWEGLGKKLVLAENVRQVLDYVGILAGVILSFARAVGEFGATIMVAGNIPGKTSTMPLAIYTSAAGGDWSKANLMVISLTALSAIALY